MNFNLIGVVALSAGIILIYSAVKKKDPRDVIKDALTGKKDSAAAPATSQPNNSVTTSDRLQRGAR